MTDDSRYALRGLTCNHCVMSVTEETSAITGVTGVAVDLHPGEVSVLTLTHREPVEVSAVQSAVATAGYELVGPIE